MTLLRFLPTEQNAKLNETERHRESRMCVDGKLKKYRNDPRVVWKKWKLQFVSENEPFWKLMTSWMNSIRKMNGLCMKMKNIWFFQCMKMREFSERKWENFSHRLCETLVGSPHSPIDFLVHLHEHKNSHAWKKKSFLLLLLLLA